MVEQVGIGMLTPGRSFAEQKMLLDIPDLPSLEEPILELGCGGDSTLGGLGRLRLENARKKNEGKAEINLVSTTVHPNLNIKVQSLPPKNSLIMANGLNQPFPKNYFGTALCLYSLPYYLNNSKKDHERFFSELHRILKPNGIARIYPIPIKKHGGSVTICPTDRNLYLSSPVYDQYTEILARLGFRIKEIVVPDPRSSEYGLLVIEKLI